MIFKILFILSFFFSFNCLAQKILEGKAKIIDGDTIHIGRDKIRLHGIDAPEINQTCKINKKFWDCGIESTNALIKYISQRKVYCDILDIDKYGRFIGICFVDKDNINKFMVKNGWAIAYRYYSLDYIVEEEFAKNSKIGIWQGEFIEPYKFRKKNK